MIMVVIIVMDAANDGHVVESSVVSGVVMAVVVIEVVLWVSGVGRGWDGGVVPVAGLGLVVAVVPVAGALVRLHVVVHGTLDGRVVHVQGGLDGGRRGKVRGRSEVARLHKKTK